MPAGLDWESDVTKGVRGTAFLADRDGHEPPGRWVRAHGVGAHGLSVGVMDGSGNGGRKGPAHARRRVLPRENEERLAEIGRQLPPPSEEELEIVAGLRASAAAAAGRGLG